MGYIPGKDVSNGRLINPPSSHRSFLQPSKLGKVGVLSCVQWRTLVRSPAGDQPCKWLGGILARTSFCPWNRLNQARSVSLRVLFYVLTFKGISVSQPKQNKRETKTNSEVLSVGFWLDWFL